MELYGVVSFLRPAIMCIPPREIQACHQGRVRPLWSHPVLAMITFSATGRERGGLGNCIREKGYFGRVS